MSNSLPFWQILDPIFGSEIKLAIYRDSQTNGGDLLENIIAMLCECHQSKMGNHGNYVDCAGKGKRTEVL